ncbi:MAG: GNAT family N-acetyltransferase [Bdellovibrionales bacterium]
MKILKIDDRNLKSQICESVLRGLPLWFGIESAIRDYVQDVKRMETWAVYKDNLAIGFASINKHFSQSAEIHVMGIFEQFHRKGIGHQLIEVISNELRFQGFKFLTVKTLSESRPNKEYEMTRHFYLKNGFVPLEEFKTLWGEANPCLLLVKIL